MQDVMDIYEDYASWKKENSHLIQTLVNKKSKAIVRFSCVIAVVDYLYHTHEDGKKLSEDEEVIFSTGFDYIYDSFMMIDNILQSDFNGDIDLMETCSQTINLLLYINDFESEITSKMSQIGCPYCSGAFLLEITRELFQTLCDVGSNNALFLDILGTPSQGLALAIQLLSLKFHRTCQGNGAPIGALSFKQYLWCGSEPNATLGCRHQ